MSEYIAMNIINMGLRVLCYTVLSSGRGIGLPLGAGAFPPIPYGQTATRPHNLCVKAPGQV